MKAAPGAGGQHHERNGITVREASVAHTPCPFSTDCRLEALTDPNGAVQAVMCHLCTFLERRSDLHDRLTGTPGVGL